MSGRRVCDHCRRRKAKCDRGFPCTRCQGLRRECTYTDILRKRGPRFLSIYPKLATSGSHSISTASGSGSEPDLSETGIYPGNDNVTSSPDLDLDLDPDLSATGASTPGFDSGSSGFFLDGVIKPPGYTSNPRTPPDLGSTNNSNSNSQNQSQSQGILPSSSMVQSVRLYIKHLYPLMPVFDIAETMQSLSSSGRGLPPQRYSFLSALCAATHCHLNVKEEDVSWEPLLADALWARTQYDVVEDKGLNGVLSSFFLFIAYWCVQKERQAWFYLREAIALALARNLQREERDRVGLEEREYEQRRRVFWVMFVAERTFCLMYDRPTVLLPWIEKPQPRNCREKGTVDGFVRIASTLEGVGIDSATWTAAGFVTPIFLRDDMENSGCLAEMPQNLPRLQKLELEVTRLWLQAKRWKLAAKRSPTPFYVSYDNWQLGQPLAIGREVLRALEPFTATLLEIRGIALERKLYDIADCVCDVAAIVQQSECTAGEAESILCGLLHTVSKFRGRIPDLFFDLQQQLQGLFL